MSDSPLFATYLIGLREGLEGTLVVSILVAYLVKSNRRRLLPYVAGGVAVAIGLSVAFGALLTYTQTSLLSEGDDRELFDAITSVAAVVFVTWMIFWMRKAARSIAGELRAKLGEAIAIGSFAVVAMAFLAVVREGLETALIFFGTVQNADNDTGPLLSLLAGIVTALAIGIGLYAGAVRINLTKFFTWTGALLVLVAAGIFKYGVHDFQEARVLPGIGDRAFDITNVLDPGSWYGALLDGMFNITGNPTWLELVAWVAYAVPVLVIFLGAVRKGPASGARKPETAPATAAQQA
jgi:high-affinity iron transporter